MHLFVVGGGTATNSVVGVFGSLAGEITYVLPISDNGGSSSEILRVLGGPAIGDARSRMTRLMPPSPLRNLLEIRLSDNAQTAQKTWDSIVYGSHPSWQLIPSHLKHMYRAFLIHVHAELLRRNRPGKEFKYNRASIGNMLLSGARLFFGSLDSAIEFVMRTANVPESIRVLPAINTNFSHHIGALLLDGTRVYGQSEISHPSSDLIDPPFKMEDDEECQEEDANMPFSHPSLSASQISFSKQSDPLPSPIESLFYVNPYGEEIKPKASSRVLEALGRADCVVFSIGSLYTSIIPVILLQGFAARLVNCNIKILILNGTHDRETNGMTGIEHVAAAVKACTYSLGLSHCDLDAIDWTSFVTHVVYPSEENVAIDVPELEQRGIQCVPAVSRNGIFDTPDLKNQLATILY